MASQKSKVTEEPLQPASVAVGGHPLLKSLALIFLVALVSHACQLSLHPLYGSTASLLNIETVVLAGTAVAAVLPSFKTSDYTLLIALAAWIGYSPYTSYALGRWAVRFRNPVFGPALAESAVVLPVILAGAGMTQRWNAAWIDRLPGIVSYRALISLIMFNWVKVCAAWLGRRIPLGGGVNSSNLLFASSATFTLWAILARTTPQPPSPQTKVNSRVSKKARSALLLPLLPIVASLFAYNLPPTSSPALPYVRTTGRSLKPSADEPPPASVRVLARTQSVTGLILVGEYIEEHYRYLRADHSLLGGRWTGSRAVTISSGPSERPGALGDSVYAAFVLQEGARLFKKQDQRPGEEQERALFIGLGIGIAAGAFIRHGIHTTVVEIDPAVYSYARQFFQLPEPNGVFLEDARGWVASTSSTLQSESDRFDYIVHDCFSGGGVPEHLFTLEFWDQVKSVLRTDGVVAVNFAGHLGSDATRGIYLTLKQSFGRCRIFHDHLDESQSSSNEFFNMVFFCQSSTSPVALRIAVEEDYLDSYLRKHILSAIAKREINEKTLLGNVTYVNSDEIEGEDEWILRDDRNSLKIWQSQSALDHWIVMRQVMPDIFWDTY